jgi:predicted nucleic acid-binding protein
MRFWDSSAIVPLVCRERETSSMLHAYALDMDMIVWGFARTEVLSALCKHARSGSLSQRAFTEAKARLALLESDWTENVDYEGVRERAERLLGTHALSAADALQLAAALVAVEEKTRGFGFVTLDTRLADAASKEGFATVGARSTSFVFPRL